MDRRHFLTTTTLTAASTATTAHARTAAPHIATNVYPWTTFYKRAGKTWGENLDADIASVATTGVQGFEPIAGSPADIERLAPLLKKHALQIRSLYVNSTLHDASLSDRSTNTVLAIADAAKAIGTRIIVTNPSPIRWGGPEDKDDAQLRTQAKNLDHLGAQLRDRGLTLAYHNHDAELRQGGREFHHMLTATSPEHVKLCLDSHWIFRGCGDSQVALFDAVQHYHQRIVELHLRQSQGGHWTEAFTMRGDIDYPLLFQKLQSWSLTPHLVLEQAIESKSPNTLTAQAAHTQSVQNLRTALA